MHRNAVTSEAILQVVMLDRHFVDWYLNASLALGVFHDDYRRVYEDVTRLAPGVALSTGIEVRATARVRPYLGAGVVAYSTDALTDSQWLELNTGVRFILGH